MEFNRTIDIAGTIVSDDSRTFIIAEAGVNHNGDIEAAKRLVDVAVNAGVDAVKFQSFKAEEIILGNVEKAPYQKKSTASGGSQFEMLKRLEIDRSAHMELIDYCQSKGIIFMTTPFDFKSLDDLDEFDLPAYKISSTDVTNIPFLVAVAKKGKPIVISTGMTYMEEVRVALETLYAFNKDVIVLQCTANYPIQNNEANLNVIDTYKAEFDILVGFSDHSVGVGASPFAVAKGAKVLEKHFTLDKTMEGPDHKASLSPEELKEYVRQVRTAEMYLGTYTKNPTLSETQTRKSLQKSVVCAEPIAKGDEYSEQNITTKRTGGQGIAAFYYYDLLGKTAEKDYNKDDIIEI